MTEGAENEVEIVIVATRSARFHVQHSQSMTTPEDKMPPSSRRENKSLTYELDNSIMLLLFSNCLSCSLVVNFISNSRVTWEMPE